jgi:hypothetical protein
VSRNILRFGIIDDKKDHPHPEILKNGLTGGGKMCKDGYAMVPKKSKVSIAALGEGNFGVPAG